MYNFYRGQRQSQPSALINFLSIIHCLAHHIWPYLHTHRVRISEGHALVYVVVCFCDC